MKRKIVRCAKMLACLPRRRRVDFVIAGAQKCGTSTLDAYLRIHPEVCMAERKEVHFFDQKKGRKYGPSDYLYYHSFFSPEEHHRVIGEVTPVYLYWKDAAQRMSTYNARMKVVVILRNPIERAFSHWNMQRDRGIESLSFWDALQRERARSAEVAPYQDKMHSYIDRGFYTRQLKQLYASFPPEQCLLLRTEDLHNDPATCVGQLTDFIGVSRLAHIERVREHARPYTQSLMPKEKAFLEAIFREEIVALEDMLGWDCSHWLS